MCSPKGGQVVGGFNVHLLPTRPGPVRFRHLSEWQTAVDRVCEAVPERDLYPADVAEAYTRGAELGYLRGVFAHRTGRGYAQTSVWDCSQVHRKRVLAVPRLWGALARGLNPLSRLVPVPRVPVPGQTLALGHVFDVLVEGAGGPRQLGGILADLRNRAHGGGADLLAVFLSWGDPLVQLPRILLQKTLRYHTLALPLAGPLPVPPLYLNIREL